MHDSVLGPVFATLRMAMHALVLALTAVVIARAALGDDEHGALVIALAIGWLAVYAGGRLLGRDRRRLLLWLALLTLGWLALLTQSAAASYLAFGMFFLYLHLLPRPHNLLAVAAATVASIAGFGMHAGWSAAAAIGPVLGAAVAVMIAGGYARLYAEVLSRQELIDELRATRAELAAQEHAAGVLAERERLAGEIHDTVAQGLSSIGMLIHAASAGIDEPATVETLTLAGQAAADALAETRALISDLSPAPLQGTSLAAALERITAGTAAHGLTPRFALDGDPVAVPMPVEAALVRLTQSAVGNVVQHSGADTVQVTLTYAPESVHLDVADNGCGFDVAAATGRTTARTDSFGLHTAARRVAELGGRLAVESEPGATVVAVSFPTAPADPAPVDPAADAASSAGRPHVAQAPA